MTLEGCFQEERDFYIGSIIYIYFLERDKATNRASNTKGKGVIGWE